MNYPENKDSDFSWSDFQNRTNGELADTLGNFIKRSIDFTNARFGGEVPAEIDLEAWDGLGIDGIPLQNFLGWFLAAMALLWLLDRLPRKTAPVAVPTVMLTWVLASNVVGVSVWNAGDPIPAGISAGASPAT